VLPTLHIGSIACEVVEEVELWVFVENNVIVPIDLA
jgi:hypothetical protein